MPPIADNRQHHVMFVDDNICVSIRGRMHDCVRSAVGSAYICFGHPDADRRSSCLVDDKFEMFASHIVEHLGYIIDTRLMRVGWPEDKRQRLHEMLVDWLQNKKARTPSEISKLLGLVRNGALLTPLGSFLSIRLQWLLTEAIRASGRNAIDDKRWWRFQKVRISAAVYADLRLMLASLEEPSNGAPHIWSRPIALLIRRACTAKLISDAAYSGMGGWSPHFKFMWRLTREDLVACGFNMRAIDKDGEDQKRWCKAHELSEEDEEMLHINPLEFIAIILDLWLGIYFIRKDPNKLGGHVIDIVADNTSALSWFRYAARTKRTAVRNLAYFAHGLIILSQTGEIANFASLHLEGKKNKVADALSRPELHPTIASAIEQYSQLQSCQAFLLPYGLLSTIARWISYDEIGASCADEMTKVLSLEPITSPPGANDTTSRRGFFRRLPRRT